MKFKENWSQFICSCTTHNIGLSYLAGASLTLTRGYIMTMRASAAFAAFLIAVLESAIFCESKCLAHSALPFLSLRRVQPRSPEHDSTRATQLPVVFVFYFSFSLAIRGLTLDVLNGCESGDYASGLKKGDVIPTCDNLSNLFGYFKAMRTCEAKLRYFDWDGQVHTAKGKTGGQQGDPLRC